jgi:hypothetical protein
MKKKIVGIFVCMLFIVTALFPIVDAVGIEKTLNNEKNVICFDDEPKIQISLPDVHVYFPLSRFKWGSIEFDDPGAVIDVDLSEIEAERVLLRFTQKIICHVQKQLFPAMIISSISRPEISASSTFQYIGSASNWEAVAHHGYYDFDKVEDETYPLIVAMTGVPLFLKWAVQVYYWLMMFSDLMNGIPSELEKIYGGVTEYQLNVHT